MNWDDGQGNVKPCRKAEKLGGRPDNKFAKGLPDASGFSGILGNPILLCVGRKGLWALDVFCCQGA